MPRVRADPGYERALGRLSPDVQRRANKALLLFCDNARSPGLHFEKLKGRDDYHSIRVNLRYRVLLRREQDGEGELFAAVDIGTHQVYRRR